MSIWKDGQTDDQVARKLLRSYLVRCHSIISREYPEIANTPPEESADYLLHLKETGRIDITLYNKSSDSIGCRITELTPPRDPVDSGIG